MQPSTAIELEPTADRVIVSVNPMAGAGPCGKRAERLCELLRQRHLAAEIVTDLEEVAERANCWHAEGSLRSLVGVGGDGTAAELANRTVPGVPITMLPGGTENLLARYLGMDGSPEAVCETIIKGNLRRLDAGKAGERLFLLMFSCGFDADVVKRLHDHRTGHIRHLSYLQPILASIRRYSFPKIEVYCEFGDEPASHESPSRLSAGWVLAFNLPCYGGGFRVAPQADGADGLLDLCTFGPRSRLDALRFVTSVVFRRHHRMPECTTGRVRRLRVTSQEPVPFQLDGDPGGMLPVEIEVLPKRLTFVVPPGETAP